MAANGRILKCFLQHSRFHSTSSVVKTSLYNFHVDHGGKMVDFAGFLLPVQYAGHSITDSHLHTRQQCSIFDVSHMLQVKIHGADRKELMERLTTADVKNLPQNKATLTVFTDKTTGGILDDLIVTNSDDGYLFVVSNAGRRDHDSGLLLQTQDIMKSEGKDVHVEALEISDVSLLAVQGPRSIDVLQALCNVDLKKLRFMSSCVTSLGGIDNCRISRCGYTGEDGFEISVPSNCASTLAGQLLTSTVAQVKLAGLGARDSLRLEAGLCLYGSDIDETTTPVEAALTWLISKNRIAQKDFPGADVICKQISEGVKRKRVGIKLDSGPPARHGNEVQSTSGEKIGSVTSGGPSPSLGYSIGMAYVDKGFAKVGTKIQISVRNKTVTGAVVKMPFLKSNYYH